MPTENPSLLDVMDSTLLYYEDVSPHEVFREAYTSLLSSLSDIAKLSSTPSSERLESALFQVVCDSCLAVYAGNSLGFPNSDPVKLSRAWAKDVLRGSWPAFVPGEYFVGADREALEKALLGLISLLADDPTVEPIHRREVPLQAEEVIKAVSPWLHFVRFSA